MGHIIDLLEFIHTSPVLATYKFSCYEDYVAKDTIQTTFRCFFFCRFFAGRSPPQIKGQLDVRTYSL